MAHHELQVGPFIAQGLERGDEFPVALVRQQEAEARQDRAVAQVVLRAHGGRVDLGRAPDPVREQGHVVHVPQGLEPIEVGDAVDEQAGTAGQRIRDLGQAHARVRLVHVRGGVKHHIGAHPFGLEATKEPAEGLEIEKAEVELDHGRLGAAVAERAFEPGKVVVPAGIPAAHDVVGVRAEALGAAAGQDGEPFARKPARQVAGVGRDAATRVPGRYPGDARRQVGAGQVVQRAQRGPGARGHGVPGEARGHPAAQVRRGAPARSRLRIAHRAQPAHQIVAVRFGPNGIGQPQVRPRPLEAVVDEPGRLRCADIALPAVRRGDHGQVEQRRFRDGQAEPLPARRRHERIRGRVEPGEFGLGQVAVDELYGRVRGMAPA